MSGVLSAVTCITICETCTSPVRTTLISAIPAALKAGELATRADLLRRRPFQVGCDRRTAMVVLVVLLLCVLNAVGFFFLLLQTHMAYCKVGTLLPNLPLNCHRIVDQIDASFRPSATVAFAMFSPYKSYPIKHQIHFDV